MPSHMLGPHVVGQRVVVRRVVPGEHGPSGGPALTDVLGTCLAWDDEHCVVQPDREPGAEPVVIALADVVSGKPVPPRTSPRLRVSPQQAQRRAMALWPDLVTEPLGDWVLRRSPTSTARRANSVLAVGPPGRGSDDAYEAVVAFYTAVDQRPIAAVVPDSAEDALFASHDWVLESHDADTVFELASVSSVARRLPRTLPAGVRLELAEGERLATARLLVDGRPVASGVAALDDDWVGFRGIEVDPERRRGGLGRAVMAALVEWGAERGATTAYLQVLGDNEPALALYDGLGFVEHHRYRYLAAPRET